MQIPKGGGVPPINTDFFEGLTGDISTAAAEPTDAIGQRVRQLRTAKGLSVTALAELTGFDEELLTRIERGEVHPQLGTIIRLSKALDSALGRLVAGPGDRPYAVTRRRQQRVVARSTSKKGRQNIYTYKSLAPEVRGRHMEALLVQLEENPSAEKSIHTGEEFIYVLEGRVALHIGDDYFELEPGDSVYYLSMTPHLIGGLGGRATILAVVYDG